MQISSRTFFIIVTVASDAAVADVCKTYRLACRPTSHWVPCAVAQAGREWTFCTENLVSQATMNTIDGMRKQLLTELQARNLIRSLEDASVNAGNHSLMRGVLVQLLCHDVMLIGTTLTARPMIASQPRHADCNICHACAPADRLLTERVDWSVTKCLWLCAEQ